MDDVVNSEQEAAAPDLECAADTLHPVRGIIATHDNRGRPFPLAALEKWIRLNTSIFKTEKIDVLARGGGLRLIPELLDFAAQDRVRLSLRTDGAEPPEIVPELVEHGVFDVLLAPVSAEETAWRAWVGAVKNAGLPLRVQIPPPRGDIAGLAALLMAADVVNIAFRDPFLPVPPCADREESAAVLQRVNALTKRLEAAEVETNILFLPFCLLDEANRPNAVNRLQFFLDHQHYQRDAYEFAEKICTRGPHRLDKAAENLLARRKSVHNAIDRALLPWLIERPTHYIRFWMLHKLTRHLPLARKARAIPESYANYLARREWNERRKRFHPHPDCAPCRYRLICDQKSAWIEEMLPGAKITAIPENTGTPREAGAVGEGRAIPDPLLLSRQRARFFDAADLPRRTFPEWQQKLAARTREILVRETPTREIPVNSYEIENHYNPFDDASTRWYSFAGTELESTPLAHLKPPFTLSLTFGGGIAEHIGFSFGTHTKIMCPMADYSHKLTLHVDKEGFYVLLRDNELMRPVEFEGFPRVPVRLGHSLTPRIAVHNVDGFLLTQTLMLWEDEAGARKAAEGVKYSVIIVSTRYTRRLQATLLGLAHQRDFDMSRAEIIVNYVPGIDATDDLLDSIGRTFPDLRIVPSPFAEENMRSKGFMINEAVKMAAGEWILLIDSDVVVPPDLFARIDAIEAGTHYIAPDGRKMLSPEKTARILLGEAHPWENYEELAAEEPDYRFREGDRVPCGFLQCVRREILEKVPYHELDHFESSDWIFGKAVQKYFGRETRLEGVVVLHLDHGGRQWYGTVKHR
jgi:hypothetical protein